MKIKRPFSSNMFKNKKISKKMRLYNALNNSNFVRKLPSFNSNNKINTSTLPQKGSSIFLNNTNILNNSKENSLDLLNLIIKSNPNQYNYQKINKKSIEINPLFIRGTDENLKRPNFNKNTEEVFYKYNLLYGSDSSNIIRTYSPKMRPMSSSVSSFNRIMSRDKNESVYVFTEEEIIELIKARCKDIGINLRENMIYKFRDYCNSKCKNRIVDLSESYLGINSIIFISRIIYNSDRISRLNLAKNNLGDNGIEILINVVKNSMSLISLNITSNSITYKGGQIIFKNLKDQQSIIDLNISSMEGTNRNRLTAVGIKEIVSFLKKNIFIEKINLSGNSIKDEGFILLCKGLNNNNNLLYLNISNNDIHSNGISKGLSLISSCKLFSLNISNNPLLNDGLKKLTDSLKNFQNLHQLNVSNCGFEFPGFEHLIIGLQFNKRIDFLNVSGNNLKSSKFEKLKPCFGTFGIKNLNMSKCSLGNETAYILGECLAENESIKNINISENKISDLGFKSFINLFSNNNSIEVFDCSVNFISDLSAKEFIKNMKYNRCLQKINFSDNQLKNEMGNLFIEILEANKTLININLIYNRVQIKTMDEINRILKMNHEKQKAKFIPNLLRDIKNLQFNPELFQFYTQNIKTKKSQQKILYKKVRQDDKYFTKLLNTDNRKINLKVQEMENIEKEISNTQEKIKEIKDNLDNLQKKIYKHEEKMNEKIDEEKKKIKKYNDQNALLKAEYNAIKNDLEIVVKETEEKLKKSKEKLNLANISLETMNKEIKRKNELYENLNNPEMLVPIKEDEMENKDRKKSSKMIIKASSNNITYNTYSNNLNSEQNVTRVTTSSNENNIISPSGYYDLKRKDLVNNIKKSLKK